jgi:Putative zinc-finger
MDEPSGCAEVRELLPELAAGVAEGEERARALRHLRGCADCRRELAALATVADELLTLAPPVHPPRGFESRVLARIAPAHRWWWQRRVLRPAAAVLLVAALSAGVTLGVAMEATADDRRLAGQYRKTLQVANGRYLTARLFTAADGARAGRVFAYQGKPSWVFVVVQYPPATGSYQVHLVTRDGLDRIIGDVGVTGGVGTWGTAIDADVAQIARIRLTGGAGAPITAAFH